MKRWISLVVAAGVLVAVVIVARRAGSGVVQPEELANLIDRADGLAVRQGPDEGAAVLFQSSDRRDLNSLKASLRVERPEQYRHCMCDGTPAIFLYAGGQQIGQITNHHAKLVRCSLWKSDATLLDAEAFLRWFDDRNIPGPRKEYEEGLRREREWDENERKWVEAMPPALRPHWPTVRYSRNPNLTPLREALAEQMPEQSARILALFSWYGSGAGQWSAFPAYEDVAQKMLLEYPTAELLAAVEGKELSKAQTEGVARLFADWTFSRLRLNDGRLLSGEPKARLLKHSLASPDADKRGQAERAFGGE